jgi:hypothetical protein
VAKRYLPHDRCGEVKEMRTILPGQYGRRPGQGLSNLSDPLVSRAESDGSDGFFPSFITGMWKL